MGDEERFRTLILASLFFLARTGGDLRFPEENLHDER